MPWLQEDLELDAAVSRLVKQVYAIKTQRTITTPLNADTEKRLKRCLQDAEQGRSAAGKYMLALAKKIGVEEPETAYVVAEMKSWDRIVDKFNARVQGGFKSPDVNDLGRGCVYVDDVKEYLNFIKIQRSKTKDGRISALDTDKVSIIEGSIDDYIANPRRSGYAGSVNFNIEIDIGKGRSGIFEVQIRPRDYQTISKKSHRLYDMIRIFDGVPEAYMTDQDREVRDALVIANHALYEELGVRSGFDKVRTTPPLEIRQEQVSQICGVLDRIGTGLETSNGRNLPWIIEAADAITYAKTSVMNIAQATSNRYHKGAPAVGHDRE